MFDEGEAARSFQFQDALGPLKDHALWEASLHDRRLKVQLKLKHEGDNWASYDEPRWWKARKVY